MTAGSDHAARILAGDLRAVARAATGIENGETWALELMRELFPHTGRARVVGITGAPGAGKSTLVNRITCRLRASAKTVGIVAVDPTSPFSGGAILGDRIRMTGHHDDPGVFIRSMATRGELGGLARTTGEVSLLLDAAGKDYVLVETVGVGQDEIEIARMADATVVVLVPGMGDDVQALKAGIMEIADVFLINKADLQGAAKLEREVRFALELARRDDGWTPAVIATVACGEGVGRGIPEAIEAVNAFLERGPRRERAVAAWRHRLRGMFRDRAAALIGEADLERAAEDVAARRRDPYTIAGEWIERIAKKH